MKSKFIEEMGVLFGKMGVPPMSGRIFAWLLICDPPHQTAGELGEALGASKGSISSNIRMLVAGGLVERTVIGSSRQAHFCIKTGSWIELIDGHGVKFREMKELAEKGLDLLGQINGASRERLYEMRDFYSFLEQEFPKMIERYNKVRKK